MKPSKFIKSKIEKEELKEKIKDILEYAKSQNTRIKELKEILKLLDG